MPGSRTSSRCKGKKFGVWLGGNEFEQHSALNKNGINPSNKAVTIVAAVSSPWTSSSHIEIDGCVGHDLQRARPGVRDQEPGHREALHAEGPEDLHDAGAREPGCSRTGSSSAATGSRTRPTRRRRRSSWRRRSRAGSTAANNWQACVNIVSQERPDARKRSSALADERGQQAHLAEPATGIGVMDRQGLARRPPSRRIQGHQEAAPKGVVHARDLRRSSREHSRSRASTYAGKRYKTALVKPHRRRQVDVDEA